MKSELQNDYRKGNVYGTLFNLAGNTGDKFFEIWTLGIWHSFCITSSTNKGFMKLYIDGKVEVALDTKSDFLLNSASNLILLNDARGNKTTRTDLTDVNIWKGIKEESFIKKWSECVTNNEEGDYLKWSTSEINLVNVSVVKNDEPLKCISENQLLVSQYMLDLKETIRFCKKLGGNVAVAKDKASQDRMIAAVNDFPECKGQFFAGYSDRDQEGNWTDINTGESMTWEYWAPGEPDNFAKVDQDCAVHYPSEEKLKDSSCKIPFCPICELELPKKFQMTGRQPFDTHFVMKNLSFFQGYMFNKIVKRDEAWESVHIENETNVLGKWLMTDVEKFPIGRKLWTRNNQSRHLSFNIFVKQPGNFFCPGGEIITSELVCNGIKDCDDGHEEIWDICRSLVQPKHLMSPNSQSLDNISIKAFVSVLKVLDISQEKSTFTLYFWLRLKWFNPTLEFYFLKENYELNNKYLTVDMMDDGNFDVIMPHPTFLHLYESHITTLDEAVYVGKRAQPTMDNGYLFMDSSKSSWETYKGSENPYIKESLHHAEFTCSFDNIQNYPFGFQDCSFEFFLIRSTAKLVAGVIQYQGSHVVGQYVIDNWSLSCGKAEETRIEGCPDCKPIFPCKVTVTMKRNLLSVIVITFIPPFLMNVINQASVYLKGDSKYDLIITVNITIMMVLASIYLSVSGSLQSTPSIKPVELYLVFNLFYPFLVITVNVVRQV